MKLSRRKMELMLVDIAVIICVYYMTNLVKVLRLHSIVLNGEINLVMENRNRLTVSGVSDVDSFDEQTVVIFTQMGELTVRGSDLHIINLSVDSGELSLEGTVNSLTYSDEQPGKGGFFSRVFR